MLKVSAPIIRMIALVALSGGSLVVGTAQIAQAATLHFAQNATDMDPADQNGAAGQNTTQTMPMKKHGAANGAMNVETRIKTLHDKLHITTAQESEWSAVAQTMRDNETAMEQLIQSRHQNPENMTAIDDLQSYQKIVQAHADGLQKMISAFQTLYSDMPDDQKKNADEVFGRFEGHRGGTTGHKKHS